MEKDLSIEQILMSIRQVIADKQIGIKAEISSSDAQDDDVYELIDVVNPADKSTNVSTAESLISKNTVAKTMEYISDIKQTINNVKGNISMQNQTIQDLALDIMRPYLKSWLDENLPDIVKNVVECEIKKLIFNQK